jgi:hypothetical protein
MATRKDMQDLATLRLQEAEALFDAGLYDGCAYLCGYVVELALKACICRLLDTPDYPAKGEYKRVFAVHDLDQLLFLAGLRGKLDPSNTKLFTNWSLAVPWNPTARRYDPVGSISRQQALEIMDAIREPTDGVLIWLKKSW